MLFTVDKIAIPTAALDAPMVLFVCLMDQLRFISAHPVNHFAESLYGILSYGGNKSPYPTHMYAGRLTEYLTPVTP